MYMHLQTSIRANFIFSDSVLKGQDRWCRRVSTCRAQHGDQLYVHLISQDIGELTEYSTVKV